MKKPLTPLALLIFLPFLNLSEPLQAWEIATPSLPPDSPVHFAIEHLKKETGTTKIQFELLASDTDLEPEGFRIVGAKESTTIQAIDQAGLMYGGLELLEHIRSGNFDSELSTLQNPYMQMRGCKLNIPLDARTPSYTDASDAGQQNIPNVWDFEYWRDYIDHMAEARFNFVSLWTLNPFPSLVRVPGYEDVSLDDVWRSRTIRSKEHYPLWGTELVTPEILSNPEIVLQISMDEKIDFWRKVMAYGKSRNVDFYFVTWNIFTDGTFGKYGITDNIDNPITRDYYRKSTIALFETYPDLKGIGLTTGENMHKVPFEQKEDWAFDTYGRGALEFATKNPARQIRFLHRQHQANPDVILERFQPLVAQENIDFVFSFKYAKAHVYSSTQQHYHPEFVENLKPTGVKTIWTQRNDDTYYYRWGSPDFVREFIQNIPTEVTQGQYFGSDQWMWGRDFLHRERPSSPLLELAKHNYQWTLWGRLSYDPTVTNQRFADWLAHKYSLSRASSLTLLDAWQNASLIYPEVTGFHWGALDFKWYIEGCQSREKQALNDTGFHDVNRFISLPPHERANCQSIPDFVAGKKTTSKTPFQVADRIEAFAKKADQTAAILDEESSPNLQATLTDIRIVAKMGQYYAAKIRGSTEVALFRAHQKPEHRDAAIEHLTEAARHWMSYTVASLAHYRNPLWTNRVGIVDFKETYQHVLDDIRIAGGDPTAQGLATTVTTEAEAIPRSWETLP